MWQANRCYPAMLQICIYVSIDNASKLNSANICYILVCSEG